MPAWQGESWGEKIRLAWRDGDGVAEGRGRDTVGEAAGWNLGRRKINCGPEAGGYKREVE